MSDTRPRCCHNVPDDNCPECIKEEYDALRAARIAYASEFPLNADGEPDVGNIHANIRLLKKQCAECDPQQIADAIRARGEPYNPD